MKKSRTHHKSNSKKIVIGAIISFVLLLSIIATIILKNKAVQEDSQGKEVEQSQEQLTEDPKSELLEDPLVDQPTEQQPTEDQPVQKPNESVATEKPEKANSNGYIEGQAEATEPTYTNGVLIVNKKYPLPKTYNKGEDPKARAAFEKMAAAAKPEGFELVAFSGFRSYEYQTTLYTNYVKRDGQEQADRYSARPGYSEHQTGLAFDIGELGKEDLWLTSEFGETPAGQWLLDHAHEYGFILRYPKGKEDITGFMYESWHFRYLGVELATKVKNKGVTLEEYLELN